jgi:hypothetical protein
MVRLPACLVSAAVAAASLLPSRDAAAQLEPPAAPIRIGELELVPSLALRLRGEYRRDPVDLGGDVWERTGVQAEDYASASPPLLRRDPAVSDSWLVAERARLGLEARLELVRAHVTLQDARALGWLPGAPADVAHPGFGVLEPYEAYLHVQTAAAQPTFELRLGRQQVQWGDGRLIGGNDWEPRGGFLDAGRMLLHFAAGLVDVELLAAMLALPGPVPPAYGSFAAPSATDEQGQPVGRTGSGAQLYGALFAIHPLDLLNVDLTGLARIARDPLPAELVRGDTFTIDLRAYGERRGVRYSAEGAYQLGRVAGYGDNRTISAFAAAGRASWQTALPASLRFELFGGYASGDGSGGTGGQLRRFDPILPEIHEQHGMMDLYAWSNLIEGGVGVGAKPHEQVDAAAGYVLAGLAEPADRWSTGALRAVGAAPDNGSRLLGHEIDARVEYRPWDPVAFSGGYGVMILGAGGKAILEASGHGSHALLHYGYLQAALHAP